MPNKKRTDLLTALQDFYHRPVARVSLELFLSIGTVIFFAIFAIRPTLVTMFNLVKQIEEKIELSNQLDKKLSALSTVQIQYQQLENRLSVLDEVIPNDPQLVYSLKVIEKQASDLSLVINGVSLTTIPETNVESDTQKLERIDLPVGIRVIGNYPTIRQFIENLMNYRRSFVIDSVSFNTEQIRGVTQLEARIIVLMPYYGDPSTLEKTL